MWGLGDTSVNSPLFPEPHSPPSRKNQHKTNDKQEERSEGAAQGLGGGLGGPPQGGNFQVISSHTSLHLEPLWDLVKCRFPFGWSDLGPGTLNFFSTGSQVRSVV